ncbi:hypothetical protein AGMMS49992_15030 [Clostridia bacterium]|nr:hypothetical protein AGMMS49992_15030 [Clostridia bacterium]
MTREIPPISSGDILELRAAIENAQPGDVIYITKDLTLNLDQYATALPKDTTASTNVVDGTIPFSIIGQPSASKGPGAKIHIGSAGNPLTVSLVGGVGSRVNFFASVSFSNISLHMSLSLEDYGVDDGKVVRGYSGYGGYVCCGENCVLVNCDAEGSIIGDGGQKGLISPFIGVSYKKLEMDRCTNNCIVSLPSYFEIGGFVGDAQCQYASIVDCVNNGSITGLSRIAGIASYISSDNLYIKGCVNKGDIDNDYGESAGIAGLMYSGINCVVKNCNNSGKITNHITGGTDENALWVDIGGIVGRLIVDSPNGGLYGCVNYGEIIGTTFCKHLGGIAGHVEPGEVVDCVNYGSIRYGGMIGGIVGGAASGSYNNPTLPSLIKRCVNRGSVYGTWRGVGGIVGSAYASTTVEDCGVCAMVGTIEADTEEAGGIVGMVQYDDYLGFYIHEGLTTIQNNVSCAQFIKVNHVLTANNGTDYVHRILGRFLPDQLNEEINTDMWGPVGDKFLLLKNNYALPSVTLVGNNSNILEGYELDHFYSIQKGGVYSKPGVTVQHDDPDYGANRLNGADATEIDPAHPLADILFPCMYPDLGPIVIPARLSCGGNRAKYPAGCTSVGLFWPDGKTLLATSTNDENGIMNLTVPESVFIGFGSYCFIVKRIRSSRSRWLNYIESFPVYVYITRNGNSHAKASICYSMMLGEPNFMV